MSPRDPEPLARDLARDYHLGRLDAGRAEAVEARYLDDAEAFTALDAAADELVDDYVDGRLLADDRARLEMLAGAPEWAERIRFARALRAVVRDGLDHEPVTAGGLGAWLREHAWPSALGLAAAAAIIAAVGVTVSTRTERAALRAQLDETTTARAAAEAAARRADTQAADERAARESLAQRLQSLTNVAVMLMPGTRGARAATVRVPEHASTVRLTAVVDDAWPATLAGVRYELRRGAVQVAGGAVNLSAVSRAEGTIAIEVAAAALSPGACELIVFLAATPGRFQEYARYPFAVVR